MKYIKTDYENGLKQLKVALMNALNSDETYDFEYVSWKLLLKCIEELEWSLVMAAASSVPSGTFVIYTNKDGKKIRCSQDPRTDRIIIQHEK